MKKFIVSLLVTVLGLSAYAGHQAMSVTHHIRMMTPDGTVVQDLGVQTNMITDAGLSMLSNNWFNALGVDFHWGDDGTANGRNSGAVTVSVAGNTATASAALFEAADTNGFGREVVFSGGSIARITNFVSDTEVELDKTLTITDETVDIWRTEITALGNELGVNTLYSEPNEGCGNNMESKTVGTDIDHGILKWWRTGVCELTAGTTVREIGISPPGSSVIFARLVLDSPAIVPESPTLLTDKASINVKFEVNKRNQPSPITGITNNCSMYLTWYDDNAYGYNSRINPNGDYQVPTASVYGPIEVSQTAQYLLVSHQTSTANPYTPTWEHARAGTKDPIEFTTNPWSSVVNWSLSGIDDFNSFQTIGAVVRYDGSDPDNKKRYYGWRLRYDAAIPIPSGAEYNFSFVRTWGRDYSGE